MMARWQRQLAIPGFGPEQQQALDRARVLLLGVGGVGCPAALYLTAAGVGSLTLVDGDTVEASNLNRQILYNNADIGRPKVEAAAEALKKLNPDIDLHTLFITADIPHIERLVISSDVIVNCLDRNNIRLKVNEICVRRGKAAAHSFVHNFSGYVIFNPGSEGCLGCLVDESYPEQVDNSVIGVAAGQAGIIAAAEAIGFLSGIVGANQSRLTFFDLAFMVWETRPVIKVPRCPACGKDSGCDE